MLYKASNIPSYLIIPIAIGIGCCYSYRQESKCLDGAVTAQNHTASEGQSPGHARLTPNSLLQLDIM